MPKPKLRRVIIEIRTILTRSEFGKAVTEIAHNSFDRDLSAVKIDEWVGNRFDNLRELFPKP